MSNGSKCSAMLWRSLLWVLLLANPLFIAMTILRAAHGIPLTWADALVQAEAGFAIPILWRHLFWEGN